MNLLPLFRNSLTTIFSLILISIQLSAQPWVQKGQDIDGAGMHQHSGRAVSMNADGTVMIIGSPGNGFVSSFPGHARVFEWNGTGWQQKGIALTGENAGDQSGNSVSINDDGNIVAIGAHMNDGSGNNAGHVRVYEWNGSAWVQIGADIDGEMTDDNSGAVSLNAAGTSLAIGARLNSGNGMQSGHVRIYDRVFSTWVQRGSDIDGEATGDISGNSVSMSNDGNVVAIGAPGNIANGQVRVYEWINNVWIQKGNDIDGDSIGDWNGFSVSLSGNGNTVAIGDPANCDAGLYAGQTRIFNFDGSNWVQLGADIEGTFEDEAGWSVSLNDAGDVVAIGALMSSSMGLGYTQVHQWNGSSWNQLGTDITASGGQTGVAVSLNNNANIVAIGANLDNDGGLAAGHVRVYENITVGISESSKNKLVNVFPNPFLNSTTIEIGRTYESITLILKNNTGQVISSQDYYHSEKINVNFKIPPGIYIVELRDNEKFIGIFRLVKM